MDQDIELALERPPDYSGSFTQRMEALRDSIAGSLGFPVHLDSDMNYSASQKLSIFLDENYRGCDKHADTSAFELAFLVSSRCPFFAIVCLHKLGHNEWARIPSGEKSNKLEVIIQRVGHELKKQELRALSEDSLVEMAIGHTTEMDGAPATVFQVLFSELF